MNGLTGGRAAALVPYALAALRIMAALLLIQHGLQKYFGFPVASERGLVDPLSLMGLAGALELAGGLLVLVGLVTRPAAFLLSGEMAVAYFMAHAPRGFYPIVNQGELAILFCFVFLFLSAAGAGALSLDRVRTARRAGTKVSAGILPEPGVG
jgi:putative oxidoreductase